MRPGVRQDNIHHVTNDASRRNATDPLGKIVDAGMRWHLSCIVAKRLTDGVRKSFVIKRNKQSAFEPKRQSTGRRFFVNGTGVKDGRDRRGERG